jgi:putative membrane protein
MFLLLWAITERSESMFFWGEGGAGWIISVISMLLSWALVITMIVFAIRWFVRHETQDTPEAILQRRFALGEIDEEEFHARSDALRRTRQ